MILTQSLLHEVFKLCILDFQTHHVDLDFVPQSDGLQDRRLELVDDTVLHFLSELLVALGVHLISFFDTLLLDLLFLFSGLGYTVRSLLSRLS